MNLSYVKDANGNTIAVQIPVAEYNKIEPLLKLLGSDMEENTLEQEPSEATDLRSFLQLRKKELEQKLPDLHQLSAEDREERI